MRLSWSTRDIEVSVPSTDSRPRIQVLSLCTEPYWAIKEQKRCQFSKLLQILQLLFQVHLLYSKRIDQGETPLFAVPCLFRLLLTKLPDFMTEAARSSESTSACRRERGFSSLHQACQLDALRKSSDPSSYHRSYPTVNTVLKCDL